MPTRFTRWCSDDLTHSSRRGGRAGQTRDVALEPYRAAFAAAGKPTADNA